MRLGRGKWWNPFVDGARLEPSERILASGRPLGWRCRTRAPELCLGSSGCALLPECPAWTPWTPMLCGQVEDWCFSSNPQARRAGLHVLMSLHNLLSPTSREEQMGPGAGWAGTSLGGLQRL